MRFSPDGIVMASLPPIARWCLEAYSLVTIAPSVPSLASAPSEPLTHVKSKKRAIVAGSTPVILRSLPSTSTVSERTCETRSTPATRASSSPPAARNGMPSLPSMT